MISYVIGLNIPQFSYNPGFTGTLKNCLCIIQSYSSESTFTMAAQYSGGTSLAMSGAGELSYIQAIRIG